MNGAGRRSEGRGATTGARQYGTQSHPERFTDRPVLFIDGGLDTDCPASTNAETVRLINERGGRAEHFVDQQVGHARSPSMRARLVDWLVSHGEPPLDCD